MQKDVILTPEGLEKLKQEIEYLSTEKRREVAARIKEAREFGDISENSEYDDAKNEQAMLESRIAALEDRIDADLLLGRHHEIIVELQTLTAAGAAARPADARAVPVGPPGRGTDRLSRHARASGRRAGDRAGARAAAARAGGARQE